jgi:hypothetical protein
MNLYLDEDSAHSDLFRMLAAAAHDVQSAGTVGMLGAEDAVQFAQAIRIQRIIFTGNHDDFEDLHKLIVAANDHHPGIIAVRRENNPRRDLTLRGIVNALGKLAASGLKLESEFFILNKWR